MGADGGVKITKVSDIKKDWKAIKENLISALERDVQDAETWALKYAQEALDESRKLPDNIDNHSGEDIVKMFSFMASCDCPYLYEDVILTGVGDNVGDNMRTLSMVLRGVYVETWT